MKFWVGVTDNGWFDFLSRRGLDEVNFWQPSAKPPFVRAPAGMPFLFKLKKPYNHIAGGGFFVTFSTLPIRLAWEVFGEKNGASSFADFGSLLDPLRGKQAGAGEVGCTVLSNVFFLPRDLWVEDPPEWSKNLVRGRFYDTSEFAGAQIWRGVERFFTDDSASSSTEASVIRDGERYGEPAMVRPRLGQASFRVLVTNAYKKRCAMTGETTLVALEAAHILPFSQLGQHAVSNGLLLRADFHRLFDQGLVTVTPDYRIRVSPRIREAWFNGKAYNRLNGTELAILPDNPIEHPNREFLEWHGQNCYQG